MTPRIWDLSCVAIGSWGTGVLLATPRYLALCAHHITGNGAERLLRHPGEGGVWEAARLQPGPLTAASPQRMRPPPCFPTSSAWRRSRASATAAG